MKPMHAQFIAIRPDLENDGHASIEMLNMQRNDTESDSATPKQWHNIYREAPFGRPSSKFSGKTFLVVLTLPLALSLIIVLAAVAEMVSQQYLNGRDCYPNGLWKEAPGATWRIMDSSYFFTPNLSFGTFTFTQVKVVDIAWDLIIGRGGQMLLAWVNYRVFNEWLVYHMEMHLTSYKMYAAVAFQTTTMGTLGVLGKEFLAFGKGTWNRFFRWLAMLCMILSTMYVLSFPTLMAAMTGYITTSSPYIEDFDSNLIEWSHIRQVVYVIPDASRLGIASLNASPLVVTLDDVQLVAAIESYEEQLPQQTTCNSSASVLGICSYYVADVTTTFSIEGTNQSAQLPAPSLNISKYMTDEAHQFGIPPKEDRRAYAFAFEQRGSDIYTPTYLVEHGSCKPSEEYQWGFSYIFLFMMSIFNFIWACIMVGMWLDTRRGSRMYKSGRRPGLLRSIMDFSAAIREELGIESEYLEEDELQRRVRDSGGALVVPKTELRVTRADTMEGGGRKRSWGRRLTKGSTF